MSTNPPILDPGRASELAHSMREQIHKVFVGQEDILDQVLVALFAAGHVLIEGVPGLAKTLAVQTLAQTVGGVFHRLQFTPDLLPSDLVGTHVYNPKTGEWSVKQGPVFANFVLADEINRTPPRTQSALLEAMSDRQVSADGETHELHRPSWWSQRRTRSSSRARIHYLRANSIDSCFVFRWATQAVKMNVAF